MEAEANTSSLLMLDEPRVLALRESKRDYTFYFRRILRSDWEKYFAGLYVSSRSEGSAQLNISDMQTAGYQLFESTVTRVLGYSKELTTAEDFKKVLPRHSAPVAGLLRRAYVSEVEDDKPLDCDLIEARIDAMWSKSPSSHSNWEYKGLVHRFAPPTIAQKKTYSRGGAINRVIGGVRKGATTVYSLRNKLLMDLYDDLIQSVEGYGVAGKPLEGVDHIRREMDGYHKAEAVSQLFTTFEDAAAEEAA
jgi:hypothetical protein